ncbi:biotin/lipoyl-containing protein [Halogeometricum limi]|uniref:Biotin-requiring enzyme n=1 Tax=Halogeometricum limi TaxID=555875 RepID=A0A1I6ITF2_9EURY|nr:biotin/lipoyl-containing protein [Halogeometricum limi]SFR69510.1 Biotin-requiring enzyme [Halogeometricum limi]
MPKLGMDMDQGLVVEWFVAEGEEVTDDQVVAEIESEKTTGEIRVRQDGVLHHVLVAEGESTGPGGAVAIVGESGEDVSELLSEATGGGVKEAEATAADATGETTGGGEASAAETSGGGETAQTTSMQISGDSGYQRRKSADGFEATVATAAVDEGKVACGVSRPLTPDFR